MEEHKLKVYEVEYASGMLRCNNRQTTEIYSDVELGEGEFIVVEHINCGVFICKVVEDTTCDYECDDEIRDCVSYRYIQHIDLSGYLAKIEREEKKKVLESKMKDAFKVIDEKKKFEYYATLDEDFKKLYDEYKQLDV